MNNLFVYLEIEDGNVAEVSLELQPRVARLPINDVN